MKILLTLLASLFVISSVSFSKSRLGEYYFGFGYAMADGGKGIDADGDFLNLSANSPASDSADFNLYFSYGNVDRNSTSGSDSSWELGLDFIYHYDEYVLTCFCNPNYEYDNFQISRRRRTASRIPT